MRRAWLGMALAACHAAPPAVAPAPPLDEAITISAYDQGDRPQLAVIEDRRWIDVADRAIALD
ncbi:MAG TPA: hypothetical protein VFP84_00975, partial [Kofleriaceae bacterium]|nr:hypothetical protein [Kofleriaceae bacterium]